MYFSYFGLAQAPFKITPDTRLFFPGGNRGAVLESLVYAVTSGEGIVKVVGEVGSGKTMMCRMLARELPENTEIVYLANPSLAPEHILHAIAFELKLPAAASDSRLKVLHILQDYLIQRHAHNVRVVTFIEEAQGMPIETLEEIRLLSNLETQDEKLLQIVMFGQPELDETLATPRIRQLKERITYSFYLTPFTAQQVAEYLTTRLRACGYKGMGLFTRGAVRRLTRNSRGLVRRINILADKSLLAAYAANTVQVSAGHVRRASRDSEFGTGRRRVGRLIGIVACVVLAVGGALWWAGGVLLEEGRGASFATRARIGDVPLTGAVARAPEGASTSTRDALPVRPPLPAQAPVPAEGKPARPALGAAREAGVTGKEGRLGR
jgi:MSHA biogenesis protein MshM